MASLEVLRLRLVISGSVREWRSLRGKTVLSFDRCGRIALRSGRDDKCGMNVLFALPLHRSPESQLLSHLQSTHPNRSFPGRPLPYPLSSRPELRSSVVEGSA